MTAEIKAYKPPEDWIPPAPAAAQDDDFLAFWNSRKRETKRILGVEVVVPTDLPLKFKQMVDDLEDAKDDKAMRALLGALFGQDSFDAWIEAGITQDQIGMLLVWGMANGAGNPTTFAEAHVLWLEQDVKKTAAAGGKAAAGPNRAARRASSKTRASASTGTSSSPTSSASTASPRKKSRTSPTARS